MSAGTISVARTSSRCGSPRFSSASYNALTRSPAGTVRSAAVSCAWIGTAPYAARKAALPKVWSKCSWVLTTARTSPAPSRRTSSTTVACREVGGVGVDDQQPVGAADHGDVDVEPLVAGDPDPVGDLGERRHGSRGQPSTQDPSSLGTPQTRVPRRRQTRRRSMQEDRKLAVLRAIVEDYVATEEPVGSKALVERHRLGCQPGDRAQRHGGAGGGGLHHPAAHQRGPGPDRQGLPVLRRPADHRQADERRRAARHLDLPRRRRRPRRRRAPGRCGCWRS